MNLMKVSRYIEDPKEQHWIIVKRILKYLKGIINFGLIYSSREKLLLKGHSDADCAGDLNTRMSISESVFTLRSECITCEFTSSTVY